MMNMKRWVLPLFLVFGSAACFAQNTNAGDIRGSVTDATGALIPGVTVTVLNVDTGVSKGYTTNDAGLYDTNSIVTGSYTVTFTRDGFEKLVRGPVTVQVGFTTVNGELKVGAATQEVTVTSDVPLLQTETSEQSTTLNSQSMVALPQVTQDWENFTILLAGASGAVNSAQGSSNPGQLVSVNGNLPYSNIIADGATTTLPHSMNANVATFENVSELQVNTSSFSAQYGIGGVIFNQVSKSGTNRFHGTAYDFIQNDMFTAHPYFATGKIPFLRYNNFGGSIGGPILKNKMFFYFNYDQIVDHGPWSWYQSLPTDAMLQGDFTGVQDLYDPTTQTIAYDANNNPYPVRKTFASENTGALAGVNAIPTTMFDKVAAAFQKFYPTTTSHIPSITPAPASIAYIGSEGELLNNWYVNTVGSSPAKRYFGRLDYDVTQNNRITMSDTEDDSDWPDMGTIAASPIGWGQGIVENNNAQITDVWNISSTTVNEARIGFTHQGSWVADRSLGKGYPAQLGWQFAKADDIPGMGTSGTYPYSWLTPADPSAYKQNLFDYSDVVTMIRGKHILHFGGEFLAYQDNSTAWGNVNAGVMQYSGQYTRHYTLDNNGIAHADSTTGFEYADFLLGYINNWSALVSPEYGGRLKSPQMFVQDDFKIRPNLTLNLGLRYQINHGWNEIHGNIASFDPTVPNPGTTPPGGLGAYWFASTHANGRTALQENVFNTFLPRVGLSWAIRPNMTVRAGFGVYSYNWSVDTYGGSSEGPALGASFGSSGGLSDNTNGVTPVALLGGNGDVITPITGGDSGVPLPYTAASQDPTRFNGTNVVYVKYHSPVPKIYQWDLSVQREVATNFMAELAIVGSHGFNLAFPTDLNQVPQSQWSSNDSQYRPYPIYGSILGSTNNAISNYNSLQASITKRMTHGLSLSFNYVWSHFLDDQDSSGWGSRGGPQDFQNASNPAANYSNSNFDVRHAFKGYVVYQLPFGKGKQFLNNNTVLDEIAGGWQISGTVVLSTGNPFTVYGNQANYSLAGTTFPDWNPGVSWKPAHQSIDNWVNTSAFLQPADGTWGNVRRNSLYGPGINVFSMSAAKSFSLPWEGISMQIRADAYNVFNHASFGSPSGTYLGGSAGSGTPYTNTTPISWVTTGGRNLQLGLRVSF